MHRTGQTEHTGHRQHYANRGNASQCIDKAPKAISVAIANASTPAITPLSKLVMARRSSIRASHAFTYSIMSIVLHARTAVAQIPLHMAG
jgi:hypothetical protein